MDNHLALTLEERQKLFGLLSSAIEASGMNLDEFLFSTAELVKSHFWMSLIQGKEDDEVDVLRERLMHGVDGVVDVLNGRTETVAEDMVVMFTVVLEAVNQVFVTLKDMQAKDAAQTQEQEPVE